MSAEIMNRLGREEQRISRQLSDGFPWLRFRRKLEQPYRDWRCEMVRERARPVGYSVICIFIVYSIMDAVLFPPELSRVTVGIRIFMICPFMGLIVWASYQDWRERTFINLYTGIYLWSSLGLVVMIMLSHQQRVWMPYDGLLLMLMGGYFLLALPFFHVVAASWALIPIYVVCESFTELPYQTLQFNVFFLLTANLIGTVGTYLVEHAHRTLYLNRQLLEIAKKKAEEDSESKSRFVAMASHDLRQPLHAMHLLVENLETEVPVQNLPLVKRVKESVRQLNQLMRSVLDISKINFGIVKISKSHLLLDRVCHQIVREYRDECEEKGISLSLEVGEDTWVYTDAVLLERIVRNLLVNAINHSNASLITLSVEPSSEYAQLTVRDNGRGIPDTDQSTIFEEFSQGSRQDKKSAGMGLGLAIVKQFADLLGIGLSLQSIENQGAAFVLRIKRGQPQVSGIAAHSHTDANSRESRSAALIPGQSQKSTHTVSMIVIDDNEDACLSLAEVLQNWGYRVSHYCSPEAALEGCEEVPSLIISDYHLQASQTGMELITTLRVKFSEDIPAILITADSDVATEIEALPSMSIAQKPVMPGQLKLLIEDRL